MLDMFYTKLKIIAFGSFSGASNDRQERKTRKCTQQIPMEKVKLTTSRLPIDVKELLTNHIDSVGHLEVLLVFFNNQEKTWTPQTLSQELRSHETSVTKHMAKLTTGGFIKNVAGDHYIYAPETIELRAKTELLHQAYKEMSVAVIGFIYEKPSDKLKGFADAFKIKKD